MATILEFPSAETQGLSYLQSQVRQLLEHKGADEALQEFAAHTVRDIYQRHVSAENYNFTLKLPESINSDDAGELRAQIEHNLASIHADNHAVVVRLIAELSLAEVKLFQLQEK